uniref:FABP domain-containing protein n=1 Tax=Caenorhabditis tropicalis TaxID=1561998 RepID=A0A1I7UAG5_9PELO
MNASKLLLLVLLATGVNGSNIRSIHTTTTDILPDEFYGTFDLDHTENFHEYLIAKGYDWLTRQFIHLSIHRKIFRRTKNKYLFDYSNLTSKKDTFHKNVRVGRKFDGEGLDGMKHEITFTVKNIHLFEEHKLPGSKVPEEVYEYYFNDHFLIQQATFNGVRGHRFFRRID